MLVDFTARLNIIYGVGRILAIDYGTKRIGLAISDEMRIIAQGLETLLVADSGSGKQTNPLTTVIQAIANIVRDREVDQVILGYPISQSGKPSARSNEVERFRSELAKVMAVPIELVDERFTTVRAQEYLSEVYSKVRAQKHPVDKVAAIVLLEDYLARKNPSPNDR